VLVKRSRRAGERGHTGQPGAPIRSRSSGHQLSKQSR
jgi:hypothetical protein